MDHIKSTLNAMNERSGTRSKANPPRDQSASPSRFEQEMVLKSRLGNGHGKCGVCHGMRFLRANVDIEHKLFGLIRFCVCHPSYAVHGARWFRSTRDL